MSKAKHTTMVVAAARAMCRISSEECGLDNEDNWKIYGEFYLRDAEAVLSACGAPELLEALRGCLKALDAIGDEMTVGERYTNAGQYLIDALEPARAAISRATGGK